MRRIFALVTVATLVAACATDTYPLPMDPPNASQRIAVAVGQPTPAIVLYISVRPGDRIEFLGAEAIGSLDGASVAFLLARPAVGANGDHVLGADLEELRGAVVTGPSASTGPDDTVGIASELTADRPGRYTVTSVRLRYRINGGEERVGEGIDVRFTVCADDPVPVDCPAT